MSLESDTLRIVRCSSDAVAFITGIDLAEGIWLWGAMEEVQSGAEALDALLGFARGGRGGRCGGWRGGECGRTWEMSGEGVGGLVGVVILEVGVWRVWIERVVGLRRKIDMMGLMMGELTMGELTIGVLTRRMRA